MDLSNKRVLLVNDDGIDAPGLVLLERSVRAHTDDVCVIAPATNQSGKARATSHGCDVRLSALGADRYRVRGTPADCTLIRLCALGAERWFDVLLSGVNDGANVADDIAASGTIGACLQAAAQDVTGYRDQSAPGGGDDYQLVGALTDTRTVVNVNFPVLDRTQDSRGIRVVKTGWRVGPPTLGERASSDGVCNDHSAHTGSEQPPCARYPERTTRE